MEKPITTEAEVDAVLSRGVTEVIQYDELREKLLTATEPLRIKLGIDPTSPNLHLGRSVPLLKLRDFMDLGHKAVLVIGDFTGTIGDTSDKDSERPMLEENFVEENSLAYIQQLRTLLTEGGREDYFDDGRIEVRRNSEWLKKRSFGELVWYADMFSVADFIARDNIKRRLDAGKRVSLKETLYPIMQGFDSVELRADVELGGTDQRFNLLAGRTMQQKIHVVGQETKKIQSIVMSPLINGLDGRKMSSSWGNTINFTDEPLDMYGKVMSMSDDMLIDYFTYFTRVPMETIAGYKADLEAGQNPMEIKHELASEIVRMYHDASAAAEARQNWVATFSGGGVPSDIQELSAGTYSTLSEILIAGDIVTSKTDFRRLLDAGALRLYNDDDFTSLAEDILPDLPATLKIGKKRFVRLIL